MAVERWHPRNDIKVTFQFRYSFFRERYFECCGADSHTKDADATPFYLGHIVREMTLEVVERLR